MRILALLALCAAISACTTTEYITLQPECTAPVMPALPELDSGDLWDALGDAEYRRLESYIDGLWSHIDEHRAVVGELCD